MLKKPGLPPPVQCDSARSKYQADLEGTYYRAPSRLEGRSSPLEARVTTAEVLACRMAATDLRCGPRKAVFQFSTPSGEFMAKSAEPSATYKAHRDHQKRWALGCVNKPSCPGIQHAG